VSLLWPESLQSCLQADSFLYDRHPQPVNGYWRANPIAVRTLLDCGQPGVPGRASDEPNESVATYLPWFVATAGGSCLREVGRIAWRCSQSFEILA
jgi:hypothetical protein